MRSEALLSLHNEWVRERATPEPAIPLWFTAPLRDRVVEEGMEVKLVCTVNSRGARTWGRGLRALWRKDGRSLLASDNVSFRAFFGGLLELHLATAHLAYIFVISFLC